MSEPTLHRKIMFGGVRVVAFLLMICSLVGAVGLATSHDPRMDSGMKWGLVVLFAAIAVVSFLMLRTSTKRRQSGR